MNKFYFQLAFFVSCSLLFISLYQTTNDILQFSHNERSCYLDQLNYITDDFLYYNDLIKLSSLNYVFFALSFIFLLFNFEDLLPKKLQKAKLKDLFQDDHII